MRKISTLVLAIVVAVAFADPASAYQVKIGARVDTDVGYIWRTGNSYSAINPFNDRRQPDLTTFYIGMPVTNYLRVDWMSNDKSTGARIEFGIRAGGPGAGHGASAVGLRYMYGWYKFGRCTLVIGHTDNLLASLAYAPYQWFGLAAIGSFTAPTTGFGSGPNAPVVLFIGHGKQYSGRFAQIALYYDVGPWTFMAAVGQAPTANIINWATGTNLPLGVTSVANTTWPRLDLVVKYKGKYIGLAPGFSVYVSEFEPITGASLENDRVLSYLLVLPFRITLGNFRIKGEVAYGRNWVAANYFGGQTAFMQAIWWGGLNDRSLTKIEDTYTLSACLGLEYHIGRVSFHLGGGYQRSDNASNDQGLSWRHGQQVKYALNFAVRYRVNKHFVISPEISYWYYGWVPILDVGSPVAGGLNPQTTMWNDLGSAWLVGISFQFRF